MTATQAAALTALETLTAEFIWNEFARLHRQALRHGLESLADHTPYTPAIYTADVAKLAGIPTAKARTALQGLAKTGRVVQHGQGHGAVAWVPMG